MKLQEALSLLSTQDFLDTIYHFSYHRCNTSAEAEDLCSDIVVAVLVAIRKQEQIENFYAFVWTIAKRVYADYSERRNRVQQTLPTEDCDSLLASKENEIDEWVEKNAEQEQIKKIFREIAFLSKVYREVMVLYYIDSLPIKTIAQRLSLKETTVKQRLFSARNSIRKEVECMSERTYVLKPIKLAISGTGNPCGNDPRSKTERMFSQNLIYLCKNSPKSAKELSEELCVPMPYIEEELDIQVRGENGRYGMLRKLENGKYAVNIHLVDYEEYDKANQIFEKHLPEFCRALQATLEKEHDQILSFPYLSPQSDLSFILWALVSRIVWNLEGKINRVLSEKYFSDRTPVKRDFSCVAVAYTDDQAPIFDFYGCDGINAARIGGYQSVFLSNIYGKHIKAHFHCGHNISQDSKLLFVLKTIGGISMDSLSESEKELAAKALADGYLRKNGSMLEPKMIVLDKQHEQAFYQLSYDFNQAMESMISQIAAELSAFMLAHIPAHLLNEYQIYTDLIAGVRILSKAIDECIREGLLVAPENEIGSEGLLLVVER